MIPQVGDSYGFLATTVFERRFSATEALSVVLTTEVNGEYTLTLQVPVGSKHWDDYKVGMTILAPVPHHYLAWDREIDYVYQRFIIANITGGGEGVLTITAEHISYMYGKMYITPFRATGVNAYNAWWRAWDNLNQKPAGIWEWYQRDPSVEISGVNVALNQPTIWKDFVYNTLIGPYGGELFFCGPEPHWYDRITQRWRRLPPHRAIYGANILTIDVSDQVDRIPHLAYPFWGKENGNLADYQELSDKYIVVDPEGDGEVAIDLTDQFTTMPTNAQLQRAANAYIQQNYTNRPDRRSIRLTLKEQKPTGITMDFDDTIVLGDDIYIKAKPWNIDGVYEIRKMKYDVLKEQVIEIEAGAPADTFAKAIIER